MPRRRGRVASRERGAHGAAVVSARTLFAVRGRCARRDAIQVSVNDVINAERLPAAAFGDVITLGQVPLEGTYAHSLVGQPLVPGASVSVRVAEQTHRTPRSQRSRKSGWRAASTPFVCARR